MKQLLKLIQKAKRSSFYLWFLNYTLSNVIPFNKPHGLKILGISDNALSIKMPFQQSNLNHIKGLHACGLATLAEYATGLLLLSRLDPAKYRLIMQSIQVVYHYQGKMDAIATLEMSDEWLNQNVYAPLETQESIIIQSEVNIHDSQKNHLCTGKIGWQIKRWDKVKTKVD